MMPASAGMPPVKLTSALLALALGVLLVSCDDRAVGIEQQGNQHPVDAQVPIPPCPNGEGLQAGSPWPMHRRCPSRTGQSPVVGAQTGSLKWRFQAGTEDWPFHNPEGGLAIAADGTIYFRSSDGHLYAVNPDGTQKWTFDFEEHPNAPIRGGSPAIGADGTIYVGAEVHLHAITPDGVLKWIGPALGTGHRDPAIGPDGTIYVALTGPEYGSSAVCAINPDDGSIKWSYETASPEGTHISGGTHISPSIGPDARLYLQPYQGVQVLDPDGSALWISEPCSFGGLEAPAIAEDGSFYIAALWSLCAFSPDGNLKWEVTAEVPAGRWFHAFPAIAADGTIYVGSYATLPDGNDATLYAFNSDGTPGWTFQIEEHFVHDPILGADGTIYFGATDNRLYALNPDGTVKWSYETDGSVFSPAIGADGTVYAISRDSYLYAFGP
jgi:outer membrane protein assembly factor BamB